MKPPPTAMRIANLTPGRCRKELRARGLPVKAHKREVRGIANPLRVVGPMHGVTFVTARAPSPLGLLDCRLALVLEPLSELLGTFGVSQVHVGSIYRKGARIAGRRHKSQHSYGLALDIISFRLRDGRLLNVERDWHAGVGDTSCGPSATMRDPDEDAITLRNIVCAVARSGLFHHLLTPCANRAHRDHLHWDIARRANYLWLR